MSKTVEELRKTLGIAHVDVPEIDSPLSLGDGEDEENPQPKEPAKLEIAVKPSVIDEELLKASDLANDYIHARNLTYTILELVGNQMAGAAKVAADTEHPRAYAVFNELASTMRNVVQDLLGLQKVYKEVKRDDKVLDAPPATPVVSTTGNVNVFNGSTASVLKILDGHRPIPTTLDIGDAEEVPVKNDNPQP